MRKLILITCLAISGLTYSQITKKLIETLKAGGRFDNELLKPKNTDASKTNAVVQKVDSMLYWNFNTTSNGWEPVPYKRYSNYTYDANNNRTSRILENYFNPNWFNSSKEDNTYNASNKVTQGLNYNWNGSSWDNSSKIDYTYNGSSNMLSRTDYSWTGSTWDNVSRITNTFSAQQNLTNALGEKWITSA
jgi:hypothetical protein